MITRAASVQEMLVQRSMRSSSETGAAHGGHGYTRKALGLPQAFARISYSALTLLGLRY